MLKVKKIRISGFRGISSPQDIDLMRGGTDPLPFVLYGLNSSGKTSFVDGLEWFFSSDNKIEWLQREDAGANAYPHQGSKDKESYVELEFSDTDKKLTVLKKEFNSKRITQPDLSSKSDFDGVYASFVIKPYLRYLEVIDFVFNMGGVEKYRKLASWMGFEAEFSFQEKMAREILPELKRRVKDLSSNVALCEKPLKELLGQTISENALLVVCNGLLRSCKAAEVSNIDDLWPRITEMNRLKPESTAGMKSNQLLEIEQSIPSSVYDESLSLSIDGFIKNAKDFLSKRELIIHNDAIDLYAKAIDVLNNNDERPAKCPVCGKEWNKEELLSHIKKELESISSAKKEKDALVAKIILLKRQVKAEVDRIKGLISKYELAKKHINTLEYMNTHAYSGYLSALADLSNEEIISKGSTNPITTEILTGIKNERQTIVTSLGEERKKLQPSKEESQLNEAILKLNQIKDNWTRAKEANTIFSFASVEADKFIAMSEALSKLIQDGIKKRFEEISKRIGEYFSLLRHDRDIKQIEIVLNEEKGRAAGRSAEIQLSYYDISVKPAYKVLSESLLNSLGLAVYFTCVKQFNDKCKFIVLDDIMNSLDIQNRDTLLDLIDKEFNDYQIILFTHDYYWFQKIQKRFPKWITKKIKHWDYKTGPIIEYARTTYDEVKEMLKDSTAIESAGIQLERHIEGILNELCENIEAEVKYRYRINQPPSMDELFSALIKRMESKLGKGNAIIDKIKNAQKYEPVLRNFTGHPRDASSATISPQEVERAMEEWFAFEKEVLCPHCRRYVEYSESKDIIECRCAGGSGIHLTKVIANGNPKT